MQPYDFILAGGGAAGLSLAYRLAPTGRRLLVIDRSPKDEDDRTFAFWSERPGPFDHLAQRSFRRIRFRAPGVDRALDLGPFRYVVLNGLDFHRHVHAVLAAAPNVDVLFEDVERVEDGDEVARVHAGGRAIAGRWVFDSLPEPGEPPRDRRRQQLWQRFEGWTVEVGHDAFDPDTPTLFDFRVPQAGDVRFFYVLPLGPRRALVEYVRTQPDEAGPAIFAHLARLGLEAPEVIRREAGASLLTDRRFPRRLGRRVMAIGVRGGRLKPSSGYAFERMQRDAEAIARSLATRGHPFAVPRDRPSYRFYDALFLDVMTHAPERMQAIFTAMFERNPPARIFRFLDERAPRRDRWKLFFSLPPGPFVRALGRTVWRRLGLSGGAEPA